MKDQEEEQLTSLIESIVENDQEQTEEGMDPFGSYVHRVRSKMHADVPLFHLRFVKGYQVLLEEMKHQQSTHESPRPKEKW